MIDQSGIKLSILRVSCWRERCLRATRQILTQPPAEMFVLYLFRSETSEYEAVHSAASDAGVRFRNARRIWRPSVINGLRKIVHAVISTTGVGRVARVAGSVRG
ncbi:hypothetical protein Cob_v003046 [Colletotrichum orbiculare MAFF 240422]|uniref:Uncharacterized protein n=1 Tax=Colletotrichum orbiculare (strain 104-T / ATCC 96160 / CBS 514.97 / LARS 414 / MAFF 240422) TaxID=1213857 RepID=A0A484FZI7_COLOR|nr:hypothetical protein Cob_v003046 [Colletotrichum orbiculare MAFF 240422]